MSYGVELDTAVDEIATDAQKIRRNALLEEIYRDVYNRLLQQVPPASFPRLLELGSGGGFFSELAPHVTTSECVRVPGVAHVVDACRLEQAFAPESLDAITMFNVFHHLPDITAFLHGASRVLRRGGRIAMVEPWFTPVGQWFYRVLHHEPYSSDPDDWTIRGQGRLAGANSRLPTSVLRDSDARFGREFPHLCIVRREPFHKWLYLLSGGLRLNTRIPRPLAQAAVRFDRAFSTGNSTLGLFALIVIDRN